MTVDVDLEASPDKDLELVGVYGFVTDKETGESVLANNPDLSTDAGTFLLFPSIDEVVSHESSIWNSLILTFIIAHYTHGQVNLPWWIR